MPADPHAPDRTAATLEAIKRFDAAFNRHDVDAIMAAMTDDCVFESTYPPPDGRRFEGQEAVRGAWEDLFRSSPDASFETEELFTVDDRCTARWTYRFSNKTHRLAVPLGRPVGKTYAVCCPRAKRHLNAACAARDARRRRVILPGLGVGREPFLPWGTREVTLGESGASTVAT
jgi:ketosteroid isomerase-like protein